MIVEIMGLLIVLGAAMVLFVRFQGNRQQRPVQEQRELQETLERLKREMDRSSNEAIQRMGGHVNQFERLIRAADEASDALERRMSDLRMLQKGIEQQMAEGNALQQRLVEQQRQCQQAYQQMAMHPFLHAATMQMPSMVELPMAQPVQGTVVDAVPPPGTEENRSFSSILQDSIERGEAAQQWPTDVYEPSGETYRGTQPQSSPEPGRVAAPRQTALPDGGVDVGVPDDDNAAERARALLRDGHSVEEVSRETGMGRGAVELLRQMVQHQMAGQ